MTDGHAVGAESPAVSLDERFDDLATSLAGFHETWLVYVGLELGLLAALREAGPDGLTTAELAARVGCDPGMIEVWALAAHAYELARHDGERLRIDDDAGAVLLDQHLPEYLGGQFVHAAIASLDYDKLLDVIRTGRAVTDRPDRYRASVERLTVQDIAVFFQEALARLPDLTADLVRGIRVVDVHCGGGRWLIAMSRRFPECALVGVESEPDSVQRARANVTGAGLADRIEIVEDRIPAIDRSTGTFDLAYFQYVLHYGDASVEALRAGWSALRPGGRLVSLEWCAPSSVDDWVGLHGQFVAGIQLDMAYQGRRLPTEERLVEMFGTAGIGDPEIVDLPSGATLAVARKAGP
jgi:SAM-dependent methyltransferase